jgi:serine/threonine-protein kinase RIO1
VHADLSEHNILVCSPDYVEHSDKNTTGEGENFQIVLIDFVQSVDINHPKAQEYLERDMDQLRHFFTKKGIKALGKGMAVLFVTGSDKILPDQATTTSNSQDFPRKSNDETTYALKKLRSVNSVSSKSTQSSGSRVNSNGIKGKHKISARSMSTTSVSTKSSMSSMCPMSPVKSHTVNQDQCSSASLVTSQECLIESSIQKTSKKEKKEKKSKKEKKEKKKKRDKLKDSSSKTCKSNDDYQKRQIFDQNTLSSSMDFRNPGEVTEIVTSMDNNVQDHHNTDHPLFPATFEASDIFSENMPDLNDTRWEQTWNSKFEE